MMFMTEAKLLSSHRLHLVKMSVHLFNFTIASGCLVHVLE